MSRHFVLRRSRAMQGGAALVVGLIMLVLITLMLLTALNLGTSSFRSGSNMQFRNEAIAAADEAIQRFIDYDFTASSTAIDGAPVPEPEPIDLNNDGEIDYFVAIARPVCLSATRAFAYDPSSLSLPVSLSLASTWNTVWDVDATVTPAQNVGGALINAGGAAVRLRSGVRVMLSQSQKNSRCP